MSRTVTNICFLLTAVAGLVGSARAEPRIWTRDTGKRLEQPMEFVQLDVAGTVTFHDAAKNPIEVPISRLCAEDQDLVRRADRVHKELARTGGGPRSATGPQKWAVIVAIRQYEPNKSGFRRLDYSDNDGRQFRKLFLALGFRQDHIFFLCDRPLKEDGKVEQPTKNAIEWTLDQVLGVAGKDRVQAMEGKAAEDDSVVIVFAGHGLDHAKRSYLCPSDGNKDDPSSSMVELERLYQQAGACRAKLRLVLLDACRNDPTSALVGTFTPTLDRAQGAAVLVASCAAGQQSFEDNRLQHGVFLFHVLDTIYAKASADDGSEERPFGVIDLYSSVEYSTKQYVTRWRKESQKPSLLSAVQENPKLALLGTLSKDSRKEWEEYKRSLFPEVLTNSIGMELVLVPSGKFMMGSPDSDKGASSDEKPQHEVRITRSD